MQEDSKYLSYLLRHNPGEVGCEIDKYGWVDVHTLCLNSRFTRSYLELIVDEDTRYEFSQDGTKIRAFHGHSIEGVVSANEFIPNCMLYHGTSEESWGKIQKDGIIRSMSRNYVHLSSDSESAKRIGSRHGKPIILVLNVEEMVKDGIKFYDSGDNVVLTSDIPIKYVVEVLQFKG